MEHQCMELTVEQIRTQIYSLPDRPPFMLAGQLAAIYECEPKQVGQAVRRNPERFPEDFCFKLTGAELNILRSQSVTSLPAKTGHSVLGFARSGANMLSAILRTPVAAARSVLIMRAFSAIEERAMSQPHGYIDRYAEGFALGYRRGRLVSEICEQCRITPTQLMEYIYFRRQGRGPRAAAVEANSRVHKAHEIEAMLRGAGIAMPEAGAKPNPREAQRVAVGIISTPPAGPLPLEARGDAEPIPASPPAPNRRRRGRPRKVVVPAEVAHE